MDSDVGADVALSFQEEAGCDDIWEKIQTAPNDPRRPGDADRDDSPPLSPSDSPRPYGRASPSGGIPNASLCIKLPSPEVHTLGEVAKALIDVPMSQRERVALYIHQEGTYLPRLLTIFRECEGQASDGGKPQDMDGLWQLFTIIKCLIMMNDMTLVVEMMSDKHFWDVLGCLEYDPELAPKKANHRHFMHVRPPATPPLRDNTFVAIPCCLLALPAT
jgi:protein phosphatase 4 regulatory subunit 3